MRCFLVLFSLLGVVSGVGAQQQGKGDFSQRPHGHGQPAKNVILFIGAGMGLTQISAAMYQDTQRLSIEKFPVTGLQKAFASNQVAADPIASATAMATGKKVNAGMLSALTRKRSVRTLLQHAKTNGMATGVLVNSDLTGAPAASFIGLPENLDNQEEIASLYLERNLDLIVGGGKKYFTSRISDTRNLASELQDKGYQVSDYQNSLFPKITLDFKQNMAHFLSEEADSNFQHAPDKYRAMLGLALQYLPRHNAGGFFLVVGIDAVQNPSSSFDTQIAGIKAYDLLIGSLLDFAREDGKTLVVVTSGAEKNGWAINPGSQRGALLMESAIGGHTGVMLPVFAFGPGASLFSGVYDNTELHRKVGEALGWD